MIRIELAKQWRRPRTLLTFAALASFTLALTAALASSGGNQFQRVGDIPLFIVPDHSGISIPVIALASTMKFFLPLAVAVFAGESVAGEAGWGSLRYALARPVSRTRYLFSKLVVALGFSIAAVMLVPLAALLAGTIAFGWHPLTAIDGSATTAVHSTIVTFAGGAALIRLGIGTAYVAAGMVSIFAFAFLLSTLTSRPFAAVAGGVGLTIVSRVLNADYLPGVAVLNHWMPNNDVDLWQHFFQDPYQTTGMSHFLVLQLIYAAAFLSIAWWWFERKDILT
ncbi:MAG TPA: ABC transporter permease [Solirubrobacteraceae bacterium]|jgi:ABC-2 type transport system permease protein|nr:ABC transporter permease [Solirubrobacteraceae bacterium]